MRIVLQRVRRASVEVDDRRVGAIGRGLLALVGVERGDDEPTADRLAEKVARLRIFEDGDGRFDRDVGAIGGRVLVVSQFTLLADTERGRRPSFARAEAPERAEPLVRRFANRLRATGLDVEEGRFGARMAVELVNDGPVTIVLERAPEREPQRPG